MKDLWSRLWRDRLLAVEVLASSLAIQVLGLASALYVILVLNRYVAHGVDATLLTLTVGALMAAVLEFLFRTARTRFLAVLSGLADGALAQNAFEVLTQARLAALTQADRGLVRSAITGLNEVRAAYAPANLAALLDIPFALVFLLVVFLLNAMLGLAAVLVMAGFLLACFALTRAVGGIAHAQVRETAQGGVLVTQGAAVPETVRAFNAGGWLAGRWQAHLERLLDLGARSQGTQSRLQALTAAGSGVLTIVVIGLGARAVVAQELDVGALIGINILVARAWGAVARYPSLREVFERARQAQGLTQELLRLPREATTGMRLTKYSGQLEFKDVAFAYGGATAPLFESLNFALPTGGILAVTGKNASGKTTFCRLLMQLLDPTRGQVQVDGVELRQIDPRWWRTQVMYAPQEAEFFDGTLLDNLTLGREVEETALNTAVRDAGLRPFLDQTPKGLQMPVADMGRQLSLGIRRRLALARALLSGGRLAVFDEPTEGLDADGVQAVYVVLNRLVAEGYSVVVCSNDPWIVRAAHWRLNLDDKPVPTMVRQHATQAAMAPATEEKTQ